MPTTSICLWFTDEAEEAAAFYTSLADDGEVGHVARYTAGGPMPEGSVMTVAFQALGLSFLALNGGEPRPHTDAMSVMVSCEDQDEIDRIWDALAEGGTEVACGWVTDRYGMRWQIVPRQLPDLMAGQSPDAAARVMAALWQMVKIDLPTLEAAARGETVAVG